jgi:hypothetical protein
MEQITVTTGGLFLVFKNDFICLLKAVGDKSVDVYQKLYNELQEMESSPTTDQNLLEKQKEKLFSLRISKYRNPVFVIVAQIKRIEILMDLAEHLNRHGKVIRTMQSDQIIWVPDSTYETLSLEEINLKLKEILPTGSDVVVDKPIEKTFIKIIEGHPYTICLFKNGDFFIDGYDGNYYMDFMKECLPDQCKV